MEVTRRDVEDLRDYMLREGRKIGGQAGMGLGARSVNLALGRLEAAFAMAVADGRLVRNPVEHVKRPRQVKGAAADLDAGGGPALPGRGGEGPAACSVAAVAVRTAPRRGHGAAVGWVRPEGEDSDGLPGPGAGGW